MISNLFWIIAAPLALAFIAGFLSYNLGAVSQAKPGAAEAESVPD